MFHSSRVFFVLKATTWQLPTSSSDARIDYSKTRNYPEHIALLLE